MIGFFSQSRRIAIIGSIIGAALGACAVWILYDGQWTAKIMLMILAAALIMNSFIYIARIVALRKYQELLLDLYEKMEIQDFLEEAEPLLDKKANVKDSVTHAVHVANAYLAQGDARAAVRLLERQQIPEQALELRGMVYSNLASAYLQLGEAENAENAMGQLRRIIGDPKCKKEFRQKAERTIAYQQICLDSLSGKKGKMEIIEQDYEKARRSLHKLNAGRFLVGLYRQRNEVKKMKEMEAYLDSVWDQQMLKS